MLDAHCNDYVTIVSASYAAYAQSTTIHVGASYVIVSVATIRLFELLLALGTHSLYCQHCCC